MKKKMRFLQICPEVYKISGKKHKYSQWFIRFPDLTLKIHPQEINTAHSYLLITFEARNCKRHSGQALYCSDSLLDPYHLLTWYQGGTHWGFWPGAWAFRRTCSHGNRVLCRTLQFGYIEHGPAYVQENLSDFKNVLGGNFDLISPVLPGGRT